MHILTPTLRRSLNLLTTATAASLFLTSCTPINLPIDRLSSILAQSSNHNTTISSTLYGSSNLVNLAENVQHELDHLRDTGRYPDHRGAELFYLWVRTPFGEPPPLHADDLRKLDLMLTTPSPGPWHRFITTENYAGWTQWRAPKSGFTNKPFTWLSKQIFVFHWSALQEMMSIEEADRLVKAAGFGGPIEWVAILNRGDVEENAKLGYYFRLEEDVGKQSPRVLLANARSGRVEEMEY